MSSLLLKIRLVSGDGGAASGSAASGSACRSLHVNATWRLSLNFTTHIIITATPTLRSLSEDSIAGDAYQSSFP
ncbi:hypothetical protein AALP_AAs72209U000100 [Arabis alpina]|uniref:Uncharacterized protein n=1 Tax=Arabis alpina TaxID=50452 RepID=A0A087G3D2_ARAAL|nr:hypothetical protein AALP_AAs72209U000100 [Arabis alpina]